jgi:hypothetical protein
LCSVLKMVFYIFFKFLFINVGSFFFFFFSIFGYTKMKQVHSGLDLLLNLAKGPLNFSKILIFFVLMI